MTVNKLPGRTLLLWQIRIVTVNILALAVCLFFRLSLKWLLIVYGAFSLICLLIIFWYLPKFIASYSIKLTGDAVIIDSGVIIKTTQLMPYSKMIYTQTFTSPLAHKFDVTAISLKAARSRVLVPEMRKSDAKNLISALSVVEEV